MTVHASFFDLKTSTDLLAKIERNLEALRKHPTDTYAAFDFFATARHLPEWHYPNDRAKVEALFATHVELRICRHLADGAKHFLLSDPRHKQVMATRHDSSAWGTVWGESWGSSWGKNALMIELDPRDPDVSNVGSSISAVDLAERVFNVLSAVVT